MATVTPVLLDASLTLPVNQPIFFGTVGPYEWNGNEFWICDEFPLGGPQNLLAFKSTDGGFTFSKIHAGFTNSNQNGNVSVFYPGTGSIVYVGWQGRETNSSTGHLHATTFDMASGTFGTDNDSGLTTRDTSIFLVNVSAGLIFLYDTTIGVTGRQVGFILWNGSSWTSPSFLSPGTGTNFLDEVVIDGAGNVGVFWNTNTTIKYTIIASGVGGSAVNALAVPSGQQGTFPYSAIYDPVSDSVAWCYQDLESGTNKISLLIGTPSAAPTFSVVDVVSDPTNTNTWQQPSIATNGTGTFSVLVWSDGLSGLLGTMSQWTATSLTGPWTGPTTYYDEVAQPPSPPPDGIELYPIYSRYLNDGTTLAVTFGTFYFIAGSEFFCGVLVYLAPRPPQLCPDIFVDRQAQPSAPTPALPPGTCTVYAPTTSTPSLIAYNEPVELQGS